MLSKIIEIVGIRLFETLRVVHLLHLFQKIKKSLRCKKSVRSLHDNPGYFLSGLNSQINLTCRKTI